MSKKFSVSAQGTDKYFKSVKAKKRELNVQDIELKFEEEISSNNVKFQLRPGRKDMRYQVVSTTLEDSEKRSWSKVGIFATQIALVDDSFTTLYVYYPKLRSKTKLKLGNCNYPLDEVKGVIMIIHGYCENVTRYEYFVNTVVPEGFIVFGIDQRGHGSFHLTEQNIFECDCSECQLRLKKISSINSLEYLLEDNKFAIREINYFIQRYKKDVPFFVYGHSMGSFTSKILMKSFHMRDEKTFLSFGEPQIELNLDFRGLILTGAGNKLGGESEKFINKTLFVLLGDVFKLPNDSCGCCDWLMNVSAPIGGGENISGDSFERAKYALDPLNCSKTTFESALHLWHLHKEQDKQEVYDKLKELDINVLLLRGGKDVMVRGFDETAKRFVKENTNVHREKDGVHELFNDVIAVRERCFAVVIKWLVTIANRD